MKPDRFLGELVRDARKSKGYTMIELAEELGLTQGYVSKIETNKNIPAIDVLKKIGSFLDIPTGDLLISAGYFKELADLIEVKTFDKLPIPTLGEAIDIARRDWTTDDKPYELYDAPLELISKEANISLEKLERIQNGENINLSIEELKNLAKALDVTFAYLYLIINRDNTFLEKAVADDFIRRLHMVSSSEAEKAKDLSFEEFCIVTSEYQLKNNSHYVPGENELMQLYKEFQFARSINSLIRSFAFSELWNNTSDIRYFIENPLVNLTYKGRKLSELDRTKILTKMAEIENEFEYEN